MTFDIKIPFPVHFAARQHHNTALLLMAQIGAIIVGAGHFQQGMGWI